MYEDSTVYIVGHGRTNNDNAITQKFLMFFIGFVIDTRNNLIVDTSCSSTIDVTDKFIKSIFVGKKFDKFYEEIEFSIYKRYFGSSQKAIIVCYKDALSKYLDIKNKYYNEVDKFDNK